MADDLESAQQGQSENPVERPPLTEELGEDIPVTKDASETPAMSADQVLPDDHDVTEDILQQALSEATAGNLDHIDEPPSPNLNTEHDPVAAPSHSQSQQYSKSTGSEGSAQTSDSLQPGEPAIASGAASNSTPLSVASKMTVGMKAAPSTSTTAVVATAPLGSKQNPIRIVQQGNTYTSMQQLSKEQIEQIVRVLKQQNVQSVGSASKAVFNPETNTRIVYKVVPPQSESKPSAPGVLTARQYHEQKYGKTKSRKRAARESDEDGPSTDAGDSDFHLDSDSEPGEMPEADVPDLSPAEKMRKKREKPITRSGRKVKPPKHMVKEYKQIHRVDWYEDYDDDDGGYSDIYDSDVSNEGKTPNYDEARRKFPCGKCEKAYIGVGGLARHYRMSGHGDPQSLAPVPKPSADTDQTGDDTQSQPSPLAPSVADSQSALSDAAEKSVATPVMTPTPAKRRGRPAKKKATGDEAWRPPAYISSRLGDEKKPRGRPPKQKEPHKSPKVGPGRPALTPAERKLRRQRRLEEIISSYSTNEILSVVCPRLSRDDVTLYDVLRSGVAFSSDRKPSYTVMLQKFTDLQARMIEMGQVCLRPIQEGEQVAEDKEAIQIATESIAHSVGVEPGFYEVSDLPAEAGDEDDEVNDEMETKTEAAAVGPEIPAPPTGAPQPETAGQVSGAETEATNVNTTTAGPDTQTNMLTMPLADATESSESMETDVTQQSVLPHAAQPGLQVSANLALSTMAAPTTLTTTAAVLSSLSNIQAGDILRINGQNIVIPEGAKLLQTESGLILYQPHS